MDFGLLIGVSTVVGIYGWFGYTLTQEKVNTLPHEDVSHGETITEDWF